MTAATINTIKPLQQPISNNFIWFIAILLSLTTHAIVLFYKNNQNNALPAVISQETTTHVRFASVSPPPVAVVEPEKKIEVKPPEPEVIQQPIIKEPVVKKLPIKKKVKKKKKPAPKKKPTPKPKAKTKPVTKKPAEKKVTVEKASSLNSPTTNKKEIVKSPIVSHADKRLVDQIRKNYLALLMRHIEAHKHYPRVARKRKIQGQIFVSFSLLADGNIKQLQVNGKKSLLKKATRNAIQNSLPMPSQPNNLSLPMKVKFNMDYFLK